ncbi:hypothetical protein E8K88_11265 [Lampropedia aestuarii]|uniref:Zinc-ribbon domain-containing protein n=1 Tax=Lampropedia aestuarii TaxID=2562762 RepID=A0A4V3YWV4_9BURK|nr:putative zinc-binding metallopeptidase [Lampropedia aestuarii]THJ32852.1 hypothetical protein E8K88_11265 [Lampropedia aestuarii]
MQTFQCTHCNSLVFFESQSCLYCSSSLGFDPDSLRLIALQALPASSANQPSGLESQAAPNALESGTPAATALSQPALWSLLDSPEAGSPDQSQAKRFKFCLNAQSQNNCNFLLDASDPSGYCLSCRQTKTIPNLSTPSNVLAWKTIENAKRRLFYTLAKLGLDVRERTPRYEFLEDVPGEDPVMTGHANGLITLNILEADDAERTRRRINLHEPYRTLLGHLRHEVGHFYWDQFFLQDALALDAFRALFGDERSDYGQALEHHYANPRQDWQQDHVSQYAAAHPWEDWAETWAHYLHLIDVQETACSYQLQFATQGHAGSIHTTVDNPFVVFAQAPQDGSPQDIGPLLNQAMGLSLLLNSLNRSLGHNDAYPFALSTAVLQKLNFVHNAVRRYRHQRTGTAATQLSD